MKYIFYVAWHSTERGMMPVTNGNGHPKLFDDLDAAWDAVDWLGCACCVGLRHLEDICRQHELTLPERKEKA